MLLRNIPREKWTKYATAFMIFGGICIVFELILHQYMSRTFVGGFFEGLIAGLGAVFSIYGLYLFGKTKRHVLNPSHESMVLET